MTLSAVSMSQLKPRFDGTIQYGHIIQALILCGGILGAWVNVRTQVIAHDKEIARHDREIQRLHDDDASIREIQNHLSENLIRLSAIIEERTHRLSAP